MNIFLNLFDKYKKKKQTHLIMTLLARDEADIIKENIEFHLNLGINFLIITDNNSIDGTREIIEEYSKSGVVHVIDEPGRDKSQYKWVKRMIFLAKEKYHADWVLNCDADEFWYPKSGNFKDELYNSEFNVLSCRRFNMLPKKIPAPFYENCLKVINPIESINYSNFSITKENFLIGKIGNKVIHKCCGFKSILQGNHGVDIKNKKVKVSDNIEIYHYPIRNYEQFKRKVIITGMAYEQNKVLSEANGVHLRRLYSLYKQGLLEEEFNYIALNDEEIESLSDAGIVQYDDTIARFFKTDKN